MHQMQPNRLWLGNAGDCRDVVGVLNLGILAVVQLAMEEEPVAYPREIICVRLPLLDGSGNDPALLNMAIGSVEHLLRSQLPALVTCGGGMSRSPAVAACALARIISADPAKVLEQVHQQSPTDVSPQLWHDLLAATSS